MPVNAALLLPDENRVRGQLCAVVADDQTRQFAEGADPVELAGNPLAGQRGVGDQSQAFAAEVVDHCENAKAPSIDEAVGDKVQRPALIAPLRQRQRRSGAECAFPAAAFANRQLLLPVQSVEFLAVQPHPFPGEQNMQPPIAETPAF